VVVRSVGLLLAGYGDGAQRNMNHKPNLIEETVEIKEVVRMETVSTPAAYITPRSTDLLRQRWLETIRSERFS
jgi:hypothetical protein